MLKFKRYSSIQNHNKITNELYNLQCKDCTMNMGESMEISKRKEEGIQEKLIVQLIDVSGDKKHISLFSMHFKPYIHRQNTRKFKQKFWPSSSIFPAIFLIWFPMAWNKTDLERLIARWHDMFRGNHWNAQKIVDIYNTLLMYLQTLTCIYQSNF